MLPLLQSKFHPPFADAPLVGRSRLTTRFRTGLTRKLTLVTAPAGYGKTSLMGQIHRQLRQQGQSTAWLSLDVRDNDFAQLIRYLVGAVRTVHPQFGESVSVLLQGGVSLGQETIVHVLANELSGIVEPIHLFIEDAHELGSDQTLSVLRQLIAGTPPWVQFFISSRTHCELSVGRLRATGQLEEIDWEDLRFTDEEVREYFSSANDLDLSSDITTKILAKTEGWAAALQLTSLAVRNSRTLSALLEKLDGDEQGVAAYLADDVLRHLHEDVRGFLLKVGTLHRVCVPLCDAITGGTDAADKLKQIDAANIFIFSSDRTRRWYRFHPLLSAFLRQQLERTSPGALTMIYARASAWFESQQYYDEAVEYAFNADDTDRAARILDEHAYDLWRSGHQSRLDGWARRVPAAIRRHYPRLRLVQAWSLTLAGKVAAAIRILEDVSIQLGADMDIGFAPDVPPESALLGDVLFIRLMIAYYKEDAELTESLCERWLLGPFSSDPFLLGAVKSALAGARGLMYELHYAQRETEAIADLMEESGTIYGPIWSFSILGAIYLGAGHMDEAVVSLKQAIAFAIRIGGADTPLAAMPATILALAYYESNDLDKARRLIEKYSSITDRLNFGDYQIASFLVPSRLHRAAGDVAAAMTILESHERAASVEQHRPERIRAHLVHEKIRLLSGLRKPAQLRSIIRDEQLNRPLDAFLPTRGGGARQAIRAQARIRAAIASNEPRVGLSLARKWSRYARDRRLPRPEIQFRVLAALAHTTLRDEPAAQRELREGIRLAAAYRIVRPFLDEDEPVRTAVARTCLSMRVTDPELATFVDGLTAMLAGGGGLGAADHVPSSQKAVGPLVPGYQQLSPRELEVIGLVAQGLSNREVGDSLGLTENTVKWNLRQLFQKLGARRRSQAVQRAREIGFIS